MTTAENIKMAQDQNGIGDNASYATIFFVTSNEQENQ